MTSYFYPTVDPTNGQLLGFGMDDNRCVLFDQTKTSGYISDASEKKVLEWRNNICVVCMCPVQNHRIVFGALWVCPQCPSRIAHASNLYTGASLRNIRMPDPFYQCKPGQKHSPLGITMALEGERPFLVARAWNQTLEDHLDNKPSIGRRKRQARMVSYGRQAGRCAICGNTFQWSQMNVDHIKPKSNGGSDMMINYQLTCYPCNSMKGNPVLQ